MIGRLATSQIIIIHCRQVIVNQRHGMDHLQCDSSWHGHFLGTAKHFTGRQTQNWSDALSSRHEGISHGFRDQISLRFRTDHRFLQSLGDGRLFAHNVFRQIKFNLTAAAGDMEG
jgi:hypothetical protein